MLDHFISLIASYLRPAFLLYWFYPMIALAFLATVPSIIRQIFLGGR